MASSNKFIFDSQENNESVLKVFTFSDERLKMSRKRLTQLTMVLIIIAVVVIIRPWYILDETEQAVILQLVNQ